MKPIMMEYGPFIYREYDEWTSPENWKDELSIPGKPE